MYLVPFALPHTKYLVLFPIPETGFIPLDDCHAMLRMQQHGDHIACDIDVGDHMTNSLSNRVHQTCTMSYPTECIKLAIACSA